jgi:polysaccharide deacetylase family protein (PEP-CTERM system associated)
VTDPIRNALTFDVEEYFHVEAFTGLVGPEDWPSFPSRVVDPTLRLLDQLDRHGVSATFFVLGWVAERHPRLVREIQRRGHELGCHSYAHRLISAMNRDTFAADLKQAKWAIEDCAGVAVIGYRAPTYSIVRSTLWALEILAEAGFWYDSSVFPIHHDRYGIPDAPRFPHRVPLTAGGEMVEFPISTVRIGGTNVPFSGGGYFRLAPYTLIRAGLRHVNERERMPAIVYLHPWEMDPEQPRLPARALTRFRHYVNIEKTATKLDRLLGDFAFGPAVEVLEASGLLEVAR